MGHFLHGPKLKYHINIGTDSNTELISLKGAETLITITIFELISGEAASQPCPGWQDGADWAWVFRFSHPPSHVWVPSGRSTGLLGPVGVHKHASLRIPSAGSELQPSQATTSGGVKLGFMGMGLGPGFGLSTGYSGLD